MMSNKNVKGILGAIVAIIALASGLAPSAATAYDRLDRRILLGNGSRETVREFYASHINNDDWEFDMLGDRVLFPGQSVIADIDDGSGYCRYDFLTVFDDGTRVVRADVNVCEIQSYTLYD